MDQSMLNSLEWRLVGPFRGGRVPAVAGHPTERATFYFGASGGGVWKTTDGGQYWENVSDGYFNTAAIGAIAIADSDPNVIYVGTGETSIRGDVSHGDGVYKSTDGGKTWQHMGLKDTHAISTIRVHPQNPEIVYVAALGHVWGPNEERGVYRSRDGGKTWDKVLSKSERAGAIDLTMDPNNPRVMFAAMWDAQRYPHALRSGGPDSSVYRTTDGGDTWTEITRNEGLPKGVLGKIGVAISPAKADRVWALIEADDGALFRSDDGGETWERVCEQGDLRRRAWYYMHIFADPSDENTVWVLNLKCWKSVDGGKTFTAVPTPHGDNQDLWIDPRDSQRMIEGNDGGACVTYNGALSWSTLYNQPTAQFYHVTTDDQVPYRLYGSQQDNTALSVPSASARGAIKETEWFEPGGGESGYIAIKPDDNNVVFGGAIGSGAGNGRLIRFDQRTMETQIVTVWPEVQGMGRGAESLKYRFQWTFPILFSPHDPDVLYVTSNVVHRSRDQGMSWEVISPDLTVADPETLKPSGGPITRDNTGAEVYGTIFAFVESPHRAGTFWAGSDDGLLHISRDGGDKWENVSIPTNLLPERALISIIEVSPHDPATAYVAATRYKHDDFRPYLFKTSDYGKSWTKITDGIPENGFTRTIREDPSQRGLLYAGTETHVYVSLDDGASWQPLQLNLPVCPIHDLLVKGTDLIAATHGRSFWILDDLTPLHQMASAVDLTNQPAHLFAPRLASRYKVYGRPGEPAVPYKTYGRVGGMTLTTYQKKNERGGIDIEYLDAGKNPPDGVIVHYWLKDKPAGEVALTFKDADGKIIRRYTSKTEGNGQADARGTDPPRGAEGMEATDLIRDLPEEQQKLHVEPGANRFVWNMRYPDAKSLEGVEENNRFGVTPDMLLGPVAVPGRYTVELTVDGQTQSQEFEIVSDPRIRASAEDLQAQFDLLMRVRDKLSETHQAVNSVRRVKEQVAAWTKRVDEGDVKDAGKALTDKLTEIEEGLVQPKAADPRMFPSGLNEKVGLLGPMIGNADTRPPQQYYEVFEKLSGEVDEQRARLKAVIDKDVKEFNEVVKRAGVAPVGV